jgi:uncharacterized membrane protein
MENLTDVSMAIVIDDADQLIAAGESGTVILQAAFAAHSTTQPGSRGHRGRKRDHRAHCAAHGARDTENPVTGALVAARKPHAEA